MGSIKVKRSALGEPELEKACLPYESMELPSKQKQTCLPEENVVTASTHSQRQPISRRRLGFSPVAVAVLRREQRRRCKVRLLSKSEVSSPYFLQDSLSPFTRL
ncbi:hypothetical protein L1049_024274 [Liquidambar formosana]|uniref:Uncharacterized protein n=1 Tax=Liquidambar formosana TaxID=63359 RepID=A0AAP0RVU6_LIQFO